ncbi:class I SAM-dependent methyltransferase [Veillonella criceti]|uniref:Putative methyltransferase n=1 Tax=Veillonella criceti TaxID=103891 RepID=A0A380NI85_9FIRM|nr:class I SAM-dependent methyltransferase [Veillonella criceti]SUP41139.1 putative methyltransferase [Veillonella criceti]
MAIVTISQKGKELEAQQAKQVADLLQLPYVPRRGLSLPNLQAQYEGEDVLILSKKGPKLYTGEGKAHEFHLSMAQLRIIAYDRGQCDHLIRALGNETVTSFLDCTAGLGSDSLLVSYARPDIKQLVALEGNPLLAYVTNYGCRHFVHKSEAVTMALRRIQVCAIRFESFLKQATTNSFDVVYFDPMFEVPVKESPQFLSLRGHVLATTMTEDILQEAKRVAKQRVIIKERPFSSVFQSWTPTYMEGGTYSNVAYGVYEI